MQAERDEFGAGAATLAYSAAVGERPRRRPGGRRKAVRKKKSFPAVPAVAGVATAVVASAGTMTVAAAGDTFAPQPAAVQAMPGGLRLDATNVSEARESAAKRTDRSARDEDQKRQLARERARALASAKERAAWEAQRARELAEAEKRQQGEKTGHTVLERVIDWSVPLDHYRLTAGYGQSSSLWSVRHTGQDFAAPVGTPVRAVGNARVVGVGWDGHYGKQVRLRHEDGTETWYCHLSGYSTSEGDYVRSGEVIGYVGSTGNSTGPHLHFEVRPGGGDPISPLPWLRGLGLPL
ncbi:MAG TPA: peptidoglycan DD-metalloendopeptidase family protein [Actinopolymorphaceae bacterium]